MDCTIEEFSSYLFITYSKPDDLKEPFLNFVNEENMYQILTGIESFYHMHPGGFDDIADKVDGKEQIMASKKNFMCFIMSRCLKLSENPTVFHFVLVCTIMCRIILVFFTTDECFKLVEMASKCLTAVFYRQYVDVFKRIDGFNGLSRFCRRLNASLDKPVRDLKEQTVRSIIKSQITDLIRRIKNVPDSNFSLNDFEKKLLYGRSDYKPISHGGDVFLWPAQDILSQEDEISLDFAMKNPDMYSEESLDRINKRCFWCRTKCSKYVLVLIKELGLCKTYVEM
ncbi:hypothetical protein AVEN_89823-1 [Araneus ventricosus]|uniref:Uncharacterized protein n=1 Tax=Araneus ventricosus TaxID=182803 RepID=A0A4Y2JYV8_ARAVE|nr:hypothetical protein AVEN_89823-1 [Araneus ventricosus]